jgi:hypothetical protein
VVDDLATAGWVVAFIAAILVMIAIILAVTGQMDETRRIMLGQ